MAGSFLVPFILADQLALQRDVYYALYVGAVLALFTAWARGTDQRLGGMFGRRWPLAVGLGLVFAAISAAVPIGPISRLVDVMSSSVQRIAR
jgi:hypothetical protein